jgi:hypothetical protein
VQVSKLPLEDRSLIGAEYIWQEDDNLRTFKVSLDDDELEWHVDFESRIITIIKSGGWLFQWDNQLPVALEDGAELYIYPYVWHRIHKGNSDLIIRVSKLKS